VEVLKVEVLDCTGCLCYEIVRFFCEVHLISMNEALIYLLIEIQRQNPGVRIRS
jgi:hypothetical protein